MEWNWMELDGMETEWNAWMGGTTENGNGMETEWKWNGNGTEDKSSM